MYIVNNMNMVKVKSESSVELEERKQEEHFSSLLILSCHANTNNHALLFSILSPPLPYLTLPRAISSLSLTAPS